MDRVDNTDILEVALTLRSEGHRLHYLEFKMKREVLKSDKFPFLLQSAAITACSEAQIIVSDNGERVFFILTDDIQEEGTVTKFYFDKKGTYQQKILRKGEPYDHTLFEQEPPEKVHLIINLKTEFLVKVKEEGQTFIGIDPKIFHNIVSESELKTNILGLYAEDRRKGILYARDQLPEQIAIICRIQVIDWFDQVLDEFTCLEVEKTDNPKYSPSLFFKNLCKNFQQNYCCLMLEDERKIRNLLDQIEGEIQYSAMRSQNEDFTTLTEPVFTPMRLPKTNDLKQARFLNIKISLKAPAEARDLLSKESGFSNIAGVKYFYRLFDRTDIAIAISNGADPQSVAGAGALEQTFNTRKAAIDLIKKSGGDPADKQNICNYLSDYDSDSEGEFYAIDDQVNQRSIAAIEKFIAACANCDDMIGKTQAFKEYQKQICQIFKHRINGYSYWLFNEYFDTDSEQD